jgi:pseudouridine-5'-phosphate glycosidase
VRLCFSPEVARALEARTAVVALESSVIAQGLPSPHNLECARRCEAAVRDEGASPATIAVIDGEVRVGLDDAQLKRLAGGGALRKLGSRDLAMAIADGATGGTTVSATCELAAAAGIRVFATGGLGGVHRGVEEHLDVSQDLPALARFAVAVVCAGAKSVLDLPKTLELLETLGVPVVGVGTDELPGFYTRQSGLKLEHQVSDPQHAARLCRVRFEQLGQGGLVFALPPPEETALRFADIERHMKGAIAAAKRKKIAGKEVTPFLLKELSARTKGKSLRANLALLEHNARFAARTAVALGDDR